MTCGLPCYSLEPQKLSLRETRIVLYGEKSLGGEGLDQQMQGQGNLDKKIKQEQAIVFFYYRLDVWCPSPKVSKNAEQELQRQETGMENWEGEELVERVHARAGQDEADALQLDICT